MSFSETEKDICERALSLKIKDSAAYEQFLSRLTYGALLRLEAIMVKYERNLEDEGG